MTQVCDVRQWRCRRGERVVQFERRCRPGLAKWFDVRFFFPRFYGTDSLNIITGLLKLSDETDLDVLNNAMEDMVEQFEEELLPVATELASRLVSIYNPGGSMPSADASMWQV